jgi:hypothetical protein
MEATGEQSCRDCGAYRDQQVFGVCDPTEGVVSKDHVAYGSAA